MVGANIDMSRLLFAAISLLCTDVFAMSSENLAYNKKVGASTVFNHFYPESAVDGYLNTFFHSEKEDRPYFWIDLGRIYNISRVDIFTRQDCCSKRLHSLEVTVGRNLDDMHQRCGYFQGPGFFDMGQMIPIRCNTTGRYVKLSITQGSYNNLELADVKVFGSILNVFKEEI